jgi:hypothetical protein
MSLQKIQRGVVPVDPGPGHGHVVDVRAVGLDGTVTGPGGGPLQPHVMGLVRQDDRLLGLVDGEVPDHQMGAVQGEVDGAVDTRMR